MYSSVYNNSNSVNVYFDDITKYKYDEIKSQYLKDSLSIIRDVNNLAFFRVVKDKITFSKEIYSILEEDLSMDVDVDIVYNYIKSPEKEDLKNKINYLSHEYNIINNNFTIHTAKGNKKYIKLLVEANFDDENELIGYVGFVKDITDDIFKDKQLSDNLLDLSSSLDELKNTFLDL